MTLGVVKAFLSQPYGKTKEERLYWETFQFAIDQLSSVFVNPSLEIHSAGKTVSDLVLKQNVKNLIDSCDFTIAVITNSNPNVFCVRGAGPSQLIKGINKSFKKASFLAASRGRTKPTD